jgi:hypothetical protein
MKRTLCLVGLLLASSGAVADEVIPLKTRPVLLGDTVRAPEPARLRPLGMLDLPDTKVNGLRLSQLSGLAWDEDDGVLYAISDKGALFHLRPQFRDDRLVGLDLLKAVPLRDAEGKPLKGRRADSEGLDILHGRNGRRGDAELVVSFERLPRIARFRPDGTWIGDYPLPAPLNDRKSYRSDNKMLESVCVDEKLGVLTMPELPLVGEREGTNRIYSLDGRSWTVSLLNKLRPSAVECLGNGRVLMLERDFGVIERSVALRLATLSSEGGSAASVETVAMLDSLEGYRLDNFEGLARHQGSRFFMVSDNNDLFVQRTLLLYFELIER